MIADFLVCYAVFFLAGLAIYRSEPGGVRMVLALIAPIVLAAVFVAWAFSKLEDGLGSIE